MNTLAELNTYSNNIITVEDDRTTIVANFVGDLGTLGITVNEDSTALITGQYGRFTEISASEVGTANVVTLTIDLSNSVGSGAQVTWGASTPASVTRSDAGGIWTATNIVTVADYDALVNGAFITYVDQDVNMSYTINASYPLATGSTKNHTRTVNTVVGTVSNELTFNATTTQTVFTSNIESLTNFPQVIDSNPSPNATYTMIINPTTAAVVDFQITQSFSYTNVGAEGINIGPFSKSGINTFLSGLQVQAIGNPTATTDIVFTLTNVQSGVVSTGTMAGFECEYIDGFSTGPNATYGENNISTLFVYGVGNVVPVVNSNLTTAYGDATYKVTVTPGSEGRLRLSGNIEPEATFITRTDTITNLNSWLGVGNPGIQYIPDAGVHSTQAMNIKIERTTGHVIQSINFSVTGVPNASALPEEGLYTNATITNSDNLRFFLKADILLVGNGGSGGIGKWNGSQATTGGGGGAGAGSVVEVIDSNLFKNQFALTQAQVSTTYGGNQSVVWSTVPTFAIKAAAYAGGAGGTIDIDTGDGNSGGQGGGGAAPSGQGGSGNYNSETFSNLTGTSTTINIQNGLNSTSVASGGSGYGGGGSGHTSSISGSSVTYAVAGPPGDDYINTFPATSTGPGSGGKGGAAPASSGAANTAGINGTTGVAYIRIYQ
tara:strand:+ start:1952 stop:3937 length:1986 start_codon:yes stop_codon:yes gene_type:complete